MNDYYSMTDESLVELCRKNDQTAWSVLYVRYLDVARALSQKYCKSGIENDDLVQEGLVGFWSAVNSFDGNGNASFSTFAAVCMRNKIINAVKSNGKKSRIPQKLCFSIDNESDIADSAMTPEDHLIIKSQAICANNAVFTKLTERERSVFCLYLCGKTYDEIAKELSISKKGVDSALQRAKRKIRTELDS